MGFGVAPPPLPARTGVGVGGWRLTAVGVGAGGTGVDVGAGGTGVDVGAFTSPPPSLLPSEDVLRPDWLTTTGCGVARGAGVGVSSPDLPLRLSGACTTAGAV